MLDNYIKWFKAHEKVLALILVVAMIVFLGNKYLNSSYDAAVAREKSAEQVLQVQKEANDKLACPKSAGTSSIPSSSRATKCSKSAIIR